MKYTAQASMGANTFSGEKKNKGGRGGEKENS